MTVYADVLIFLNLFINFFILQATAKLCHDGYRLFRMIAAAFVGALFSLYIFLPQVNWAVDILFKLSVSAVIILICFGFDSIKSLCRRIGVFFASSFLYGGIMICIWAIFKPDNMAVNNSIVYIDISPTVLLTATVLSYLIISLIRIISSRQADLGKRYSVEIVFKEKKITLKALADTGNSLSDTITGAPVIIIEKSAAENLVNVIPCIETVLAGTANKNIGFRIIPYSHIGGHGLLPAFKPDKVVIKTQSDNLNIENVLVAVSSERLGEDYKAILNPDILKKQF